MLPRLTLIAALSLLGACGSNSGSGSPDSVLADDQDPFLAQNAAQDNVTTTASGLQYEVLRAADGPKPSDDSIITVHYKGELIDGTEFDSSYKRGEPNTFPLSGTIPGWIEGLQLMSVGSQYRLVMPAELAYGDAGAGELIGPGATLIFEVELLEINGS